MTQGDVIEGSVQVKVGRRELWLAPLSLNGVIRVQELQEQPPPETVAAFISQGLEIILLSVRRNHPEITADDLREDIDTYNAQKLVDKVMEVATAGVPKAPGETTQSPSAGAPSSPASRARRAGRGNTSASTSR